MGPKSGDEATFDPGFYLLRNGSENYAAPLRKIKAKPSIPDTSTSDLNFEQTGYGNVNTENWN